MRLRYASDDRPRLRRLKKSADEIAVVRLLEGMRGNDVRLGLVA